MPPAWWLAEVAALPAAVELASAARLEAESDARGAEDKANRLTQTVLALLTLAVGVGAFQLKFVVAHGWAWAAMIAPALAAIVFLAVSAFTAVHVDGVGVYRRVQPDDLASQTELTMIEALLAAHERGRAFARWTATHKATDVLQARAWLTRGIAALLIAGLVAAASIAVK
jgi:hypothetical protein